MRSAAREKQLWAVDRWLFGSIFAKQPRAQSQGPVFVEILLIQAIDRPAARTIFL
jgi:hypothetical protein